MADVYNTLEALKKEVFGSGLPDLVPESAILQKLIPFKKAKMIGKKFVQAMRVSYPQGFTHAKGDGTAGAFTLNDARPGVAVRAEVQGSQTLLRDLITYEDANATTREAFMDGPGFILQGMQASARLRLEAHMLYGGSGLATLSSISASGTSATLTLTDASFASGMYIGQEGMLLDVYRGATQINTNAQIILEGVSPDAHTIDVTGNATDLAALAADDVLYHKSAYGNEMSGIHKIVTNTGTLFNLDSTTSSLLSGTTYNAGGAVPSLQVVKRGISRAIAKGFTGKCVQLFNQTAWEKILENVVDMRQVNDKEVKNVEIGHEKITIIVGAASVDLLAHTMVKPSDSFGLSLPTWSRIGSRDIKLGDLVESGEQTFWPNSSVAGAECRLYHNQAIFSEMPGRQLYISNLAAVAPNS